MPRPVTPPPDTIEPHPPEFVPTPQPGEATPAAPPEIIVPTPDRDVPDTDPPGFPAPTDGTTLS